MNNTDIFSFNSSFLFGSAVSSFQVEQAADQPHSDWGRHVRDQYYEIVRPGEKGPQWIEWANAKRDIQTMHELGLGMQRISLEWARIESAKGHFDHAAISYYKQLIESLQQAGLEPMATLHHFTLPQWVAQNGGWQNTRTVDHFLHYVKRMVHELPDVKFWVIVNEPGVQLPFGYLNGYFPPRKRSAIRFLLARHNMLSAHKKAYQLIKQSKPAAQAGSAFSCLWLRPDDPLSRIERLGTYLGNYLLNTNYIAACQNESDFIGINYYMGYYFDFKLSSSHQTFRQDSSTVPANIPFIGTTVRPHSFRSDFGWPVVPDFFYSVLHNVYTSYKKPIYITENGIADRDDTYRGMYILTHLIAMQRAIREGCDIRGYAHWSTIDNLEWNEGYSKRFGLIKLNPVTGRRKTQHSAFLYSEIAKSRTINIDYLMKKYIRPELHPICNRIIKDLLECRTVRGMRLQYGR